jgi:hypothetical protein
MKKREARITLHFPNLRDVVLTYPLGRKARRAVAKAKKARRMLRKGIL